MPRVCWVIFKYIRAWLYKANTIFLFPQVRQLLRCRIFDGPILNLPVHS